MKNEYTERIQKIDLILATRKTLREMLIAPAAC